YAFVAGAEHDGAELSVAVVGEDGTVIYGPSTAHTLAVHGGGTTPVSKVAPKLTVKAKKKVRAGKKAVVKVSVTAPGLTPSGKVTVKVAGKSKTVKLNAKGKARVEIKVK